MNSAVSPGPGPLADSRVRTTVVPTATTRRAAGLDDGRLAFVDAGAGLEAFARLAKAEPFVRRRPLGANEEQLDPASGAGLLPQQPRGDHPGVVEDEEIALAEQLGQVSELPVPGGAGGAREVQEPRSVALGERVLGDLLRREREVEILDAQN